MSKAAQKTAEPTQTEQESEALIQLKSLVDITQQQLHQANDRANLWEARHAKLRDFIARLTAELVDTQLTLDMANGKLQEANKTIARLQQDVELLNKARAETGNGENGGEK